MKITGFDTLHADAGRSFSFLKITTDRGITGWSEFTGISERHRRMGLDSLIHAMMRGLIGRDPREVERIESDLLCGIRLSQSGLNHQALGAIQNALIDITAKALGVPVYRLFGGPLRTRIPLYWSHFGITRMGRMAKLNEKKPINTLQEFSAMPWTPRTQATAQSKPRFTTSTTPEEGRSFRLTDGTRARRSITSNPGYSTPSSSRWRRFANRWAMTSI